MLGAKKKIAAHKMKQREAANRIDVAKQDIMKIAKEYGEEIGKPFTSHGTDWSPQDVDGFVARLRQKRVEEGTWPKGELPCESGTSNCNVSS